ncbi:SMI1/KNR4 family protein [Nocardia colli]|uniref:SMI1/KNR4 family protein n=1 Tax=Nocardia colli TaxID=2545717 RepID=UPI0035DD8B9A
MRLFRTTLLMMAAVAACAACARPAPGGDSSDWCNEVITGLNAEHQRWYDYDKTHGGENEDLEWMRTKPNPPATSEAIRAAEQRLGTHFNDELRQWLAHADGWEFFAGTSSLYPTAQLVKDSPTRTIMTELMEEFNVTASAVGVGSLDDLILLGANDSADMFIVTVGCSGQACASAPVWQIHGTPTKYNSLREFLTSKVGQLKTQKQ